MITEPVSQDSSEVKSVDSPPVPRLKHVYDHVLRIELAKKLGYHNPLQAPRLSCIVINMGVGEAVRDSKKIQDAQRDLAAISGQKPLITLARRSAANFKLRQGMPIGCKVTLRRARMYEFLDRLITIALPRSRDFRGLKTSSFDGYGNFSLGIKEQIIFPEIDYDKIDEIRGMDISIITTARNNEEGLALLKGFNMPFQT